MAFKDVLRKQRQSGSGLVSSAAGAAGASIREAIDIRNILFTKDSLLGALFPNVKGFKASGKTPRSKTSPSGLMSMGSSGSNLSDAKLDIISQNTKISAKNSMVMPSMARDMNVMRQNIVKMVKLSGGKPSTSADMFFLKSAERESAYESALAKSKSTTKSTTATRVGSNAQSKTGDTGSSMLSSVLSGGFNMIKDILKGLVATFTIFSGIMSSIASSAIFKLFTGGIATLLKSVFAAIGSPLVLGIIAGFLPLLYTMFKVKDILNAPAVKDELRETQLQSNKNTQVESENIKIGDKTANDLIREEQNLYLLSKSKRITDSEKKQSAARRKALESVGIFALEVDDPSRPKKKQLLFRREVNQDNIGGLDLPPEAPAAPAAPAAPTPTPVPTDKLTAQQIERASTAPTAVSGSATTAAGNTTTKGLLDIIAKGESGAAGYNAMNQGGNKQTGIIGSGNSEKIIGKKLTEMTIGEILQRGKLPMRNQDRVFAAGRYQIIPKTLKGLVDQGVAKESDKFDETTQDKLGSALIEQTGALRLAQQGDFAEAQNKLAAVWGAIPSATTGTTALGGPNKADPKLASLVQSTLRASGTQIAAASAAVDASRRQAMAPASIVPVSSGGATPKTPGPQAQQVTIPSTLDSDLFDALIGRATEFA